MTELLTAAQMRAIEQAAIESGEVTGLELMERAGAGVVEAIFEEWPELAKTSHRAVVLCGPGNNGGDGFVVARLLKEWGWQVEVFLYGDEGKLPADAKVNCERWREMGEVNPLQSGVIDEAVTNAIGREGADINGFPDLERGQRTLFFDALFGTGLSKKFNDVLTDISKEWCDYCYENGVAIDVPSGLCADSGKPIGGNWFYSSIVVSFEAQKTGSHLGDCLCDIDKSYIVSLDIPPTGENTVTLLDETEIELDCRGLIGDGLQKSLHKNKYSHGHAYILSGPASKTGAARLAARGALRIGAGIVTVASPPDALAEHAAQLNAIMLTPVADAQALTAVLADERINAICVGPALGLDQDRVEVLAAVLAVKRATVVDADGLTLLAQNPELMALLHDKCVLTPHGGEFARVFPDIAEKLSAPATKGPAYSKVDATREAAKRAGCVVLYKGADTVIADAQGRCAINSANYERSAPWLATAGSGDVLAGFITGLMARGFAPMQAAETGAWLHVECALKFGPGLIAEDLPEQLPEVFRDLEL